MKEGARNSDTFFQKIVFPTSKEDFLAILDLSPNLIQPWNDNCISPMTAVSSCSSFSSGYLSPLPRCPDLISDASSPVEETIEAWTPRSMGTSSGFHTPTCSSPDIYPSSPVFPSKTERLSEEQSPYSASIAPSKRPSSLLKCSAPPAYKPYLLPPPRSISHHRFDTPRGIRSSTDISDNNLGQITRTVSIDGLSPASSDLHLRCKRIPVPLGEWRPMRAPRLPPGSKKTIEFWTKEIASGDNIPGTFLADRFHEDTGRSLTFENDLPFPDKKEKGLNLRILWPGYPEFSKKISVHKSLSECTVRDVRDWVFNAISDFIRNPGDIQSQGNDFWRVGAEDNDAIHLEDLVLVRLNQVGKGTWIPELDFLDWK
ncbi:hypothetical protein K439DRAFT_828049 [Ramaria rubella]|nr:hypothetical protein K439DRAFT_828049 [Ramaria rubella]